MVVGFVGSIAVEQDSWDIDGGGAYEAMFGLNIHIGIAASLMTDSSFDSMCDA